MPTMEQIEEGYFNYLVNEVLETIYKADRYDCKDFAAVKLCFYKNMFNLLQSKEKFEEYLKIISEYEYKKKIYERK